MKCPRKLLLISIFLLITLTSCHKVDKTVNTYELAEVEKNLENDYMEAKDNHYINLSFDEISVIFPRGKEEIYELEIKPKYIHYRDEKMTKLIKEQVEVSKKYLGNKIKDIDFEIRLFSDGNTKSYQYGEKFLKEIKSGMHAKKELELVLYDKMEETEQYMQLDPTYSLVWMSAGGLKKSGKGSISMIMAVAQEKVKPVRTYYRNAADGSINDEYKLGNGNLTIQGGIDFVENYMNERIQYSVDKKVPKQVDKVYVIPLKDNTYGYYFTLRKTYEGVMFDTWKEGRNYQSGSSEALSVYDTAGVFMFEKDNVDFFYGNINNQDIKKQGEAVKKVVSLKEACRLVSDFLDKKEEYNVTGIEFSYRVKYIEENQEEKRAYPVWKFEVKNKNTSDKAKIYINAVSGEVEIVKLP